MVDLDDDDLVEIHTIPPEAPDAAEPAAAAPPEQAYEPSRPPASAGGFDWPSSVPPAPGTASLQNPEVPPAAGTPAEASAAGSSDAELTSSADQVVHSRPKATYGLELEEDDEEPPASSRRPIASSMDEALADAAAREVPLKTPPPESGPQEAAIAPQEDSVPPEVSDGLPGASEAEQLAGGLPTSAQLGNTVPLDDAGAADFEVQPPSERLARESAPAPPSEDFEIRLPKRVPAGSYDSDLAPPPEARQELEAHRERAEGSLDAERGQHAAPSEPVAGAGAAADNELIERAPVRHGAVTRVTGAPQRFRPGSFLELLDASLKLGRD